LAVNPDNNLLYVPDNTATVTVYNLDGTAHAVTGAWTGASVPIAIAVAP
jgi:hypothetical protein